MKFVAVRDERRCRMDVWRSRILPVIDLTRASSWMLKKSTFRLQLASQTPTNSMIPCWRMGVFQQAPTAMTRLAYGDPR